MDIEKVIVPSGFFEQLEQYTLDLPYRYAAPLAKALGQVKELNTVEEHDEVLASNTN
jgi:hypothetical protein|tara:strand:- start:89 stop:259 length:171 start_codon:yes stop_codon:yes gene_type:complete